MAACLFRYHLLWETLSIFQKALIAAISMFMWKNKDLDHSKLKKFMLHNDNCPFFFPMWNIKPLHLEVGLHCLMARLQEEIFMNLSERSSKVWCFIPAFDSFKCSPNFPLYLLVFLLLSFQFYSFLYIIRQNKISLSYL